MSVTSSQPTCPKFCFLASRVKFYISAGLFLMFVIMAQCKEKKKFFTITHWLENTGCG